MVNDREMVFEQLKENSVEENRDVILQLSELQGELVRQRSNSKAQKIRKITVMET